MLQYPENVLVILEKLELIIVNSSRTVAITTGIFAIKILLTIGKNDLALFFLNAYTNPDNIAIVITGVTNSFIISKTFPNKFLKNKEKLPYVLNKDLLAIPKILSSNIATSQITKTTIAILKNLLPESKVTVFNDSIGSLKKDEINPFAS